MNTMFNLGLFISIILLICGCDQGQGPVGPGNRNSGNIGSGSLGAWTVPVDQVFDGGPGKDGIPALEDPDLIDAVQADYLNDEDLVLGYKNGETVIAYPHAILDWHEIINDKVDFHAFAVTYCPLTGTGIGWSREVEGQETTFGVSGLLYNSNLIPYDRLSDSNWSQMRLESINGTFKGKSVSTFQLVETTWQTWQEMFPETKVVSTQTGHSRNYENYPYGDYKTNHNNLIFPVSPEDDRLPTKERVHGIIVKGEAKAYRFEDFAEGLAVIEDVVNDQEVIVVGDKEKNFIMSFRRKLLDGTIPQFEAAPEGSPARVVLIDNEGNNWSIFGEALSGPRQGEKLVPTKSFIGFWFSWGAFYPGLKLFGAN